MRIAYRGMTGPNGPLGESLNLLGPIGPDENILNLIALAGDM